MGVRRSSAARRWFARASVALALVAAAPAVVASDPLLTLPTTLPARVLHVPILMYHRIDRARQGDPAITRALTVPLSDFAAQMRWLHGHGYHAITQLALFEALEHGARLPTRPVVITFDDGYADIMGAAHVLHDLGMPATAYVITDRIGSKSGFLTWGQLRELETLGFDIGSHTVNHLSLPTLSDAQIHHELGHSRAVLERHLGHPVQWFCYPAGRFNDRVVTAVRAAGYVLATTTIGGTQQSAEHPLRLRRVRVSHSNGTSGLAGLLGG